MEFLTSVYVSARRLLTPFISLSNTQERYQGRFQGDTKLKNTSRENLAVFFFPVWSQDCAFFSVWDLKNEDDDSYNEQNPQIRVVTIVQCFTKNVPIWKSTKHADIVQFFLLSDVKIEYES